MKGRIAVLVGLVALTGFGAVASADFGISGGQIGSDTQATKTVVVAASGDGVNHSAGSFGAGSVIYGFKVIANAATSSCVLYDAATVPGSGTTGIIDELAEATLGDTAAHFWPTPVKLTTDLSLVVQNGTCIVYYR